MKMDARELARRTKRASGKFASVSTETKNAALECAKDELKSNAAELLRINAIDADNARGACAEAFLDRLILNESRIKAMLDGLDDVIALPDCVGRAVEERTLKNGLRVKRVRAPLGVVGIIYESRPNVTLDASALCLKSGNGVVLKGGKEAINSNRFIAGLIRNALARCGLDPDLVGFLDSVDRRDVAELLHCAGDVDVIIPRGGESLKRFVLREAEMPVIASSGGNCHAYVEKTAKYDMAEKIVLNAKLSRPSVCNALETLLVDRAVAKEFLPRLLGALASHSVEIRGTEEVREIYRDATPISPDEFYVEYNAPILKVRVVGGFDEAIEHINKYGTNHSDCIVTEDPELQARFAREADSGCVYVNASTRFTDGFELGLGAEMGISTQKLHVRGPIGLEDLTSVKYVISGSGQIRE